jgi:hypothetical protein
MGKASSSKKVARAAGTGGGRTNRGRTPWMYYGIILLAVVLGTAAVVASRSHRLSSIAAAGKVTPPVANSDHWHMAYGIDLCGKMEPFIASTNNPDGIHSKNDGVIYIEPTNDSAAGKNAVLGKFSSAVHMTLNAGEIKVPGGHDYHDGDPCQGHPGRVQVQVFSSIGDQKGQLARTDPQSVPLSPDQGMLTMAFLPRGATIPRPTAAAIANLQKIITASAASTTTTTAPGSSTTSSSAPARAATTTTPATTTTTTEAPPTTAKK